MDTRSNFLLAMAAVLVWGVGSSSSSSSAKQGLVTEPNLQMAKALVSQAKAYYSHYSANDHHQLAEESVDGTNWRLAAALGDCAKLYDEAEPRLDRLMTPSAHGFTAEDAGIWLSAALTSHRSCLDGLKERGLAVEMSTARNLTAVLTDALAFYATISKAHHRHHHSHGSSKRITEGPQGSEYGGILKSWDPAKSKADIVVARDGSGTHRTINAAVDALSSKLLKTEGGEKTRRVIIYVKAGVYREKVEIGRRLKNVMFVGDGIDKTVVTGDKNYVDGYSTISSATFDVRGDGFWARDMTFENTAGPAKHQAVALRVSSDHSLFYRCSFRGYQDTLYAHSLRQFYRDCLISGTVDFIFGNAAAVFQNCDILVRRPMAHQSNMVTAQARDSPDEPTGFTIHGSRVRAGPDFEPVQGSFRTFLGRPWRRYSRVVVWKSGLDGLVDPRGWTEWDGGYGLATLFYAEYGNVGTGAETRRRVQWPGFHVLKSDRDVTPFTIKNFIDGGRWIPGSGVPVLMDL